MADGMRGTVQWYLVFILVGILEGVVMAVPDYQISVSPPGRESSWREAETACQGRDLHMFTETSTIRINNLKDKLQAGTQYWVGGRVQTTSWTWDGTNDALYTHIGFAPVELIDRYKRRNEAVPHNQVFTCMVSCSTHYVGLQDNDCVCLLKNPKPPTNTTEQCIKCPGNDDEYCGNSTGYSVYHDRLAYIPKFRASRNNRYAFKWAYLVKLSDGNLSVASTNSSTEKKGILCSSMSSPGYTHFSSGSVTRDAALEECGKNGEILFYLMETQKFDNIPPGEYWIGLKRNYSWKWITGSDMEQSPVSSSGRGQCAGVLRTSNVTLGSYSCSDKKGYICTKSRIEGMGIAPGPQGGPNSRSVALENWKVYVGVGVVATVLVLCLAVAVFMLVRRKPNTVYKRDDAGDQPKLTPYIVEPSVMESEYSDVRDAIMGGSSPLPDDTADEGIYSEPCRESGNFTGKIKNQLVSKTVHDDGSLERISAEAQQTGYDVPENKGKNVGPFYSVPTRPVVDQDVEYIVPCVPDNTSGPRTQTQNPESKGRYDVPVAGGSIDKTLPATGHIQFKGGVSGKSLTEIEGAVNSESNPKWEPGRYDVPRSNDNTDASRAGQQVSTDTLYATPIVADQLYAVPKK